MTHWTTNKPTKPGWYWWRHAGYPDGAWIERVYVRAGVAQCDNTWGILKPIDSMAREWSSEPIAEPEEV